MARNHILVPFGYKEVKSNVKGTLLIIDGFDKWESEDVAGAIRMAEERTFAELVFVPQHDATLKRMKQPCEKPFFERIKHLEQMIEEERDEGGVPISIDHWEGKRKSYTPLNALLRFLTDKYDGPHFVYMNESCANMFASTPEFDAWMKKLRLMIGTNPQASIHPKLELMRHRWEEADFRSVN